MKATFSVLAALVLVSQAHAQTYLDQYGNPVQVAPQQQQQQQQQNQLQQQQKQVQYEESTNTVVEVTPTQTVNVQQTPVLFQQPVYQAPVTVVEGKHMRDSKADSLRKARTDMETDTEQKIVEKLEEARMRDEAARAEKLFGGAALAPQATAEATATATVITTPAPVMAQPVAPPTVEVIGASASSGAVASGSTSAAAAAAEARLEIQSAPQAEQVDVKSEIRAALDERDSAKKKDKQQLYVGALAGMSEYPDVVNMRGNGSTGFAVGVVSKNRVIVEGSFQYSNFDIEDLTYGSGAFPVFKNLDQYNTSAAVKFQLFPGSLRPYLGGLVSYTHRTYSDKNMGYYNGPETECSTQAVDVGVTAGADISISDNFAIGADFKYMMNVTSRKDSRYQESIVNPSAGFGSSVEDLQYYTMSIVGKFLF